MMKKEYRKSRSVEAMTQYIRELLKDHVKESSPLALSKDVEESKSALIGYFQSKNSTAYEVRNCGGLSENHPEITVFSRRGHSTWEPPE